MKNVLFLTYYFPPAPLAYSQRVGKLCKYLVGVTDWLPKVICGELPWDTLPGRDDALAAEIPATVTIERVDNFMASILARKLRALHLYKPIGLLRKFLSPPDAFADWIGRAVATAEQKFPQGKGIEVIFCSGPPNSVFLAGLRLSKTWGKPLVIDLRDPWLPLYGKGHWFDRWYSRKTEALERSVYDHASTIILNTEGFEVAMKHRYPELTSKIVVVPNGFDPDDINWHVGPQLRQPGEPDGTIYILNLGGIRGSDVEGTFLKILEAYFQEKPEERDKIKVHFVGGTANQIEPLVHELALSKVWTAHGIVPTNAVGRPLGEADIYTLLQPEHHTFSVPSKLFYYLAGGGYIFAMVPERLANELRQNFPETNDIFEFADKINGTAALARIIERARKAKRPQPGDSLPAWAQPFDRRQIARQVADVLDSAVNSFK
jgi:hypothetical protein